MLSTIRITATCLAVWAVIAAIGPGKAPGQAREPASGPADQANSAAAILAQVAADLRQADMTDHLQTVKTLVAKLTGPSITLTAEDAEAVRKLADQLKALAPSYEALKPERTAMLKRNAQRLQQAADAMSALAKTAVAPAAPAKTASGVELLVHMSYTAPVVRPPPAGRTPTPTPAPVPSPAPLKVLTIKLADGAESFNTASAFASYLGTHYADKLVGATIRIDPAGDVAFRDLQELVRALAANQKIAAIRVENLPLRAVEAGPPIPAPPAPAEPVPPTPAPVPSEPPASVPPPSSAPIASPASQPAASGPVGPSSAPSAGSTSRPALDPKLAAMLKGKHVAFVLDCRGPDLAAAHPAAVQLAKTLAADAQFTLVHTETHGYAAKFGPYRNTQDGLKSLQKDALPPEKLKDCHKTDLMSCLSAAAATGADTITVLTTSTGVAGDLGQCLGERTVAVRVNVVYLGDIPLPAREPFEAISSKTGGQTLVLGMAKLTDMVSPR